MTHQEGGVQRPPECVGPIAIPPAVMRALRALADAARVDYIVPLSICAAEVARRLPHRARPTRARVIHSPLETTTPLSPESWSSPTVSFRGALERSGSCWASTVPVDVTILISPQGDRLYVETVTNSAGVPSAHSWARAFLALLACMTAEPDTPLADHALVGVGT